jgi:ribose 5-phosphate isomerase A
MDVASQNRWKQEAAEAAARLAESGMVVGLGTGSTAEYFINAIGRRVTEEGLRITTISSSERTEAQARALHLPVTSFAEHTEIDLAVDGADEVQQHTLYLIKGRGGALLREKIVAAACKRWIVVADESKIVEKLGSLVAVPVEIVPFGWQATAKELAEIGAIPSLRLVELGNDQAKPYITDGGNYILDCAFGVIENPKEIAHHLDHVVGAVEHGLFLGYAREVYVGGPGGVKILRAGKS